MLVLVGVETFINNINIEMAVIFALAHAVLLYAHIIAAVKEAKRKRQWFPTVLFRNILIATALVGGAALLFDTLLAVVILISGIGMYIALGIERGNTAKSSGNSSRIDESCKHGQIVRYDANRASTGSKRRSRNYRGRNNGSTIDVELID